MHLSRIELKDWKAYVAAAIDLRAPIGGRNVTLIGAQNGFGKTSLFEAIVLGLFGRDGLPLIARAPFGLSADDRVQVSYNSFLASSLHSGAITDGRQQCSVSLTFEDDNGEPLILRRIWYFAPDGKHKPADEELRVYRGRAERLEGCPPNEDEVEWRRAFVARELLPHNLASFFLFDGEQVQVLAERDMSAQIRTGIEGLLGIQILRELATDLQNYANTRRSQAGGGKASPKEMDRIRNELLVLEDSHVKAEAKLEETQGEHQRLGTRRDVLTRDLASMGAGTSDSTVKDRFEELNRIKRTLEELYEQLQASLSNDLSLALAGKSLRDQTLARLSAETIREDWEAGRKQSETGLERFLGAVGKGLATIEPELLDVQRDAVEKVVGSSWEELWHPPPENCAESYLHPYLRGAERDATASTLQRISQISNDSIANILEKIGHAEKSHGRLENEIAQLEGISPQVEAKANEIKKLNQEVDALASEMGKLRRELDALEAQINQKRKEHARYTERLDKAAPSVRRANWADKVAVAIKSIVADAVPGQIDAVSDAMTRAFRAMSHKDIVERVEIDESCNVRLLSSAGMDVRELALSAGEQQVFAQALIAAIAEISQRRFPFVIDTPLSRLDDAHRDGVLRHFSDRDNQVILLSTDTEVMGTYLDLLKPRLGATYHVEYERDGIVGKSRIQPGYFPGTGV